MNMYQMVAASCACEVYLMCLADIVLSLVGSLRNAAVNMRAPDG